MNNELIKKEELDLLPTIYKNSSEIVAKAELAATNLLAKIEAEGMNQELDELCKGAIIRATTRQKELSSERMPITKVFDNVKSKFTKNEAALDVKKETSKFYLLQKKRDEYAQFLIRKQREDEAKRQADAANKASAIDQKVDLAKYLNSLFLMVLDSQAIKMYNGLIKQAQDCINIQPSPYSFSIDEEKYISMALPKGIQGTDDLINEWDRLKMLNIDKYKRYLAEAEKELKFYIHDTISISDNKNMRFYDLLIASRDGYDKLVELIKDRFETESTKEIDSVKNEEKLNNSIASLKLETTVSLPEVKNTFIINVSKADGWVKLFSFWFANEGSMLPLEDIERKTLSQIKAFAEKEVLKTGTMIEDEGIIYEEVIKSVNRK